MAAGKAGPFGEIEFPYPKAYVDQWTSRPTATEFSKILAKYDLPVNDVVLFA